ncbi:MAG TPA: MAP_0585 family protein [Mycobacterium sp.]|nr:MAP_0585 family protein [Mycobacterium sp.]
MPTQCPNWDKNCTPAPAPSPTSGYGGSGTTPPNNTPPSPWQQPAPNNTPPSSWQQAPPNGSTSAMPTVCPAWYKNCTPAPGPGPGPSSGYGGSGSTPPNGAPWGGATPTTGAPWGGTTNQPGENNSYPPRPPRPVLNAPWSQPPHPPYYPPPPPILRPTGEIGGPTNLPGGFCIPGQGAPPPPPPSGYGWSNGPAPGSPPPYWEGPPPAGGWNGPPPAGGWNQPWQGTPVDASYGQNYFSPFTYNNYTVLPVFNSDYGGFGYWFFGTWVPLY